MKESHGNRPYGPAKTSISDPICTLQGAGMATLSVVITVERILAESIEDVSVLVNGFQSTTMPNERANSPVTDPATGNKIHTYDWSDSVACNATYNIQAVAIVVLRTTASSTVKSANCPPCEEP